MGLEQISYIVIGGVRYQVAEVHDLTGSNDEGKHVWLNGRIWSQSAKIEVEQDMDPQVKVAVLWHEAVHGMLNQAGYDDHDEQMVTALGYALPQFVRDNPQLIELTLKREG